jgi:mono/diheme cytochrome c family protein
MLRSLIVHGLLTGAVLVAASTRGEAQGAADGRALYLKHCRTCHGTSGTPSKQALRETPKIAKLDQAFLDARSDDSLRVVITRGAGKDMKPFKDKMTAQEIDAVVAYVRAFATAKR